MTMSKPVFVSYSANREDVILNRVFGNRDSGFYIDVGAAHPLYENDTKALYDRGWRGVNIEPSPEFFPELAAQRPLDRNMNVAASDVPGSITFYQVVGTGLSTCDADEAEKAAAKGFEVVPHVIEAMTLRGILETTPTTTIDLLKVDVEGLELQVLSSNDWTRFRPKVILAEATFPETPVRRADGVAPYLAAQGYRQVYFDGLNDYYVDEDFQATPEMFDRPPNLFDNFETYLQHELSEERDNALVFIASLQAELRRAMRRAETLPIDIENARAELLSMRERGTALAAQLEAMSQESAAQLEAMSQEHAAQLEAMSQESAAQLEAMSQEHAAQLEAMSQEHAASTKQLQESVSRLTNQLGQVYTSTSWRITRPLRGLARPGRSLWTLFRRPSR